MKSIAEAAAINVVAPRLLRRAVGAAALGNAMEWFDFGAYNYIAVTLGKVFFPAQDPAAQQLSALVTFALAFLIRPVGAAFFGPLGDRIGRQRVLAATMLLMSAGTFSIGLIPSHQRIGIMAPILLLLARLAQGFSTGGEYGGATTFIAEFAPDKRRGFYGSWLEVGTCAGFALGAAVAALLTGALNQDQLLSWGWRVPFLLAGPLGLIGLYIRLRLEETPAFRALGDRVVVRQGLRDILRTQARPLLLCVALVVVFNVPDFIVLSYMPSYLAGTLHVAESRALLLSVLVLLVMMAAIPWAGALSDRIGRRPMVAACCVLFLALSVPCFLVIRTGSSAGIFGGMMVLGLALTGFIGTMPSTLPALFPTEIRYGALAIAYNISISLFGATSLPINAWLVQVTGDTLVPAYYLMGTSAIGLIVVWFLRESAGQALPGSPPLIGATPGAPVTKASPIA